MIVSRYEASSNGYVKLYVRGRGVVEEHRYLMEQHLGRPLLRTEHVHHLDGDKQNNNLDNLAVIDASTHHRLHLRPATLIEFDCPVCGSTFHRQKGNAFIESPCCSKACAARRSAVSRRGVTDACQVCGHPTPRFGRYPGRCKNCRKCSERGCEGTAKSLGLCIKHYSKRRRDMARGDERSNRSRRAGKGRGSGTTTAASQTTGRSDDADQVVAQPVRPSRPIKKGKACKHTNQIRKLGRPYCTDCGEFV